MLKMGQITDDSKVLSRGNAVLRKAAEFAPQSIFLDVVMLRLGDLITLKQLRALSQAESTPAAILMAAEGQPKEAEYYKSLGAVDIIAKPFNPCLDRKNRERYHD